MSSIGLPHPVSATPVKSSGVQSDDTPETTTATPAPTVTAEMKQNDTKAKMRADQKNAGWLRGLAASVNLDKIAKHAGNASDALQVVGKGMQIAGIEGSIVSLGALAPTLGVSSVVLGEAVNVAAAAASLVETGANAIKDLKNRDLESAGKTVVEGLGKAGIALI